MYTYKTCHRSCTMRDGSNEVDICFLFLYEWCGGVNRVLCRYLVRVRILKEKSFIRWIFAFRFSMNEGGGVNHGLCGYLVSQCGYYEGEKVIYDVSSEVDICFPFPYEYGVSMVFRVDI